MTTTNEPGVLSGDALRLLQRAGKIKSISIFYEAGQINARLLVGLGLLRSLGLDEFMITPLGRDYLDSVAPLQIPAIPKIARPKSALVPKIPDTADERPLQKRKRKRKATMKPQPRTVPDGVKPVAFRRLSTRQQKILTYIDQYMKDIGFPPTIREIGDQVSIPSTSVVGYNITKLIHAGWLERTDGVSRGIRIIREMPGGKTRNDIHVAKGVLKIAINLNGDPDAVIESAQVAIERLQGIIKTAGEAL